MLKCEESPPNQFLLAIRQFNAQEWYDCHETLEEIWLGEKGEVKDFIRGILQIAVALYHWRNGNHGGAVRLLASGVNYLSRASDACLSVDVVQLIADANVMREVLEGVDSERMAQIDDALVPLIKTVSAAYP